jgi:hypothetical protein
MQTKSLLALPRILPCCFLFFMLYSCKSTCSKTVSCPAYNDIQLDQWFPYNDSEQLIFKSTANVYDTFKLHLRDSTTKYNYTTGYNRPSNGCSAQKSYSTNERDSNSYSLFYIRLSTAQPDYSTTQSASFNLSLSGMEFQGSNFTDSGFNNARIYYLNAASEIVTPQFLQDYSLNGTIYHQAQSILADTSVQKVLTGVYKIIYAKNAGLIEYETNPGNIVWIKQ